MGESTSQQRENWKAYECRENALKNIVFGPDQILVAPPTVDAWKALASVMAAHGYKIRAQDTASYNCRAITGGSGKSLHSYGIALDVNWDTNPYKKTPDGRQVRFSSKPTQEERAKEVNLQRADTDMTPEMIRDVLAIKTVGGKTVFDWGGNWDRIKDTMHFEMDVAPGDLSGGIDWATVKGSEGGPPASVAWVTEPRIPSSVPLAAAGVALGKFELVYPVVEKWEGSFDNDPDDPGGPTNMGITQADLARWRHRPVSVDEVAGLTREEARRIFRAFYYDPIRGDELPLCAAQVCYNSAVLEGLRKGGQYLQQVLRQQGRDVAVDGTIGPLTIAACSQIDLRKLVTDYTAASEAYLRGRPGFAKYGKGWLNRLNDVRAVAMGMAEIAPPPQPIVVPAAPQGPAHVPAAPIPSEGVPTMDSAQALAKLQELLAILRAAGINVGQMIQPSAAPAPSPAGVNFTTGPAQQMPPAADLSTLVQQIIQLLQIIKPSAEQPGAASTTQETDQLRKILEIIQAVAGVKGGGAAPLGQVNGALGETLGKLLNGKKSAIGIAGALVTTLLANVPPASGLGQVLAMITPAAGLSQFALPIFLATGAWGVLGKLEKWAQGTAPLPTTSK